MKFVPIFAIVAVMAIFAIDIPSREIPYPFDKHNYAVACQCGDCGLMIDKIEDLGGIVTDWQCVGCSDVPIPVKDGMYQHYMECSQITFAMYPAKYLALTGKLPTTAEPTP